MQGPSSRGQVAAAVVVALVLVAPMTALAVPGDGGGLGVNPAQSAELVESCRTIDEPGTYELAGDLTAADAEDCIRIGASDVVLDGNGHALAGGNASGAGVLVSGGEDAPTNVTVRALTAANWSNGVAVGTLDGGGTGLRVADVTVRENRHAGLRLSNVENVTVRGVTATGNDDGVTLWETRNSTLRDVEAADNGEYGVSVLAVSSGNALRNVTATGNGGDVERGGGVYFSTDTGDNALVDARVDDNRGTGVRFSDSFANELRDSVVADNDDAGVFGVPAYGDAVRNVTAVGNGGPAVQHGQGNSRFVAERLRLGDAAWVSFDAEPVGVERVDATALPEPPRPLASGAGVALSDVGDGVTASVSVDDPAASSLWRHGDTGWQRVVDQQANPEAGTVSGTVTGDGSVVALADPASQADQAGPGGSDGDGQGGTGDQNATVGQGGGATGSVGDGTFVVQGTTDGDFGYLFVVDGSAEGTETGSVSADSGDSVVDNGDGTVTVVGSTGSNAGDAFEVSGEVVEFYSPAGAGEYVLELDGEDVTDEVPEPGEDE